MAKIHYGVKTSRKQGVPKMAKSQYGVKPDIFKYAGTLKFGFEVWHGKKRKKKKKKTKIRQDSGWLARGEGWGHRTLKSDFASPCLTQKIEH